MKYNKASKFEKPLEECPIRCSDCLYYNGSHFCKANGAISVTCSFSNPKDRPLMHPVNCFWWYANNVFDKLSDSKIKEIVEYRLHLLTSGRILSEMPYGNERNNFVEHIRRNSGGGLIDFKIYPEAKSIYDQIKKDDGR